MSAILHGHTCARSSPPMAARARLLTMQVPPEAGHAQWRVFVYVPAVARGCARCGTTSSLASR
eukprot:3195883-Pyramimonas_sp.AAC.1